MTTVYVGQTKEMLCILRINLAILLLPFFYWAKLYHKRLGREQKITGNCMNMNIEHWREFEAEWNFVTSMEIGAKKLSQ